jgi:hypothetical protein
MRLTTFSFASRTRWQLLKEILTTNFSLLEGFTKDNLSVKNSEKQKGCSLMKAKQDGKFVATQKFSIFTVSCLLSTQLFYVCEC